MSSDPDATATNAQPPQPGPALLAERTVAGVLVHLLGVGSFGLLPAVVHVASDHEFTRANARNAANWQLLYAGAHLAVVLLVAVAAAVDDALAASLPALPARALRLGVGIALTVGVGALFVGFLCNVAFVTVATAKAIFGDAWSYPLAPDAVGWLAARTGDGGPRWWLVVAGYALGAPLPFAAVFLGPHDHGALFALTFLLVLGLLVGAALGAAALYRDARHLAATDADWRPNWIAYLSVPAGTGVAVYLAAEPVWDSIEPAGDAVYAFAAALWLVALVYSYRRHDRVGAP